MGILPVGFLRGRRRCRFSPLVGGRLSIAIKKARRSAGPLHRKFLEPQ